jgi:hypothetical protein
VLGLCSLGVLGWRSAARAAATITLAAGLVMLPWIARNYVVYRAFVPGVSTGGLGLWFGSGPYGGRPIGGIDAPEVPDSVRAMFAHMGELEQNRWALTQAKRGIAADPGRYLRLSLKKVMRLWLNLGYEGHRPSRASWLVAAFNLAVLALAAMGARFARPPPPAVTCLVGLALFWTAVYVPFYTVVRYAYPYYALVFGFAAAGIEAWLPRGLHER